jgi:hypothetical protein
MTVLERPAFSAAREMASEIVTIAKRLCFMAEVQDNVTTGIYYSINTQPNI